MALILTGNSSSLTVDSTSGITFPNATIQAVAAQTGPAFSASQTSAQTIPHNSYTKVQFQTEAFDTANCFDNATNYRFTPNVAGYYQVNGMVALNACISPAIIASLYKNGSEYFRGQRTGTTTSIQTDTGISCLLYLNGSTDYIELYCYQASGSNVATETNASGTNTYFQASLARVA